MFPRATAVSAGLLHRDQPSHNRQLAPDNVLGDAGAFQLVRLLAQS